MTLNVEIEGQVYENFTRAEVVRSMRSLLGSFSFEATANKANVLPVKGNEQVRILADGEVIMTGYADPLDVQYSASGHSITASGRDLAQDLVDSSVKGDKSFSGGTLSNLIEKVLLNLGLNLKVISNVTGLAAFDTIAAATTSQKAYEFLEGYARKRQVILNTDADSNIIIVRGSTTPSGIVLNHVKNDITLRNNILSANIGFDNTNRYNTYQARSNSNPGAGGIFAISDSPKEIVNVKNSAIDSKVRSTRYLEFEAEESMKAEDLGKRAQWEANIRRANSFYYSCTVQGHRTDSGEIWEPNTLVVVNDEYMGLQTNLLISDVTFSYDLSNGSTTRLDMTLPDAFSIQAELDAISGNTQELGFEFIL